MKLFSFSTRLCQLLLTIGLISGALAPRARAVFLPSTIDLDVVVEAYNSAPAWHSYLIEGWLHLQVNPAAPTAYTGTFTDNLNKGNSFAASASFADVTKPTLTIESRYGRFRFVMDTDFGGVGSTLSSSVKVRPDRFANVAYLGLIGAQHQYVSLSYAMQLDFALGIIGPKGVGSNLRLNLIRDGNRFLVPKNPQTGAKSTLSVPKTTGFTITSIASGGFFGAREISGTSPVGFHCVVQYGSRYVMLSSDAVEDETKFFSGSAVISGSGSAAAIGLFSLSPTP